MSQTALAPPSPQSRLFLCLRVPWAPPPFANATRLLSESVTPGPRSRVSMCKMYTVLAVPACPLEDPVACWIARLLSSQCLNVTTLH